MPKNTLKMPIFYIYVQKLPIESEYIREFLRKMAYFWGVIHLYLCVAGIL